MDTPADQIVTLAKALIERPSITPKDEGCQDLLASHLQPLGFTIEHLRFGDVNNLWARRGSELPLFVFAGHTDVVPPGPLDQWTSPPFHPTIREDYLYGRGAADMKSSIAAMVIACKQFIQQVPQHKGSIAFLITSDEEGPAINGTTKVIEHLMTKKEVLTWCLVGEASSDKHLGDTIKIGRLGSLSAKLRVHGKQGHIAYPQLANNPIHRSIEAFNELCHTIWDHGSAAFPPTSLQFSNVHAGTGAGNVIPNHLEAAFNFRYSPEVTEAQLRQRVLSILDMYQLKYDIEWQHSGGPFLTEQGKLLKAASQAIEELTGIKPELSTTGGTSDGRFIAKTGCQVIELGPRNNSIHQIDEHVYVPDLLKLSKIYQRILTLLFE